MCHPVFPAISTIHAPPDNSHKTEGIEIGNIYIIKLNNNQEGNQVLKIRIIGGLSRQGKQRLLHPKV